MNAGKVNADDYLKKLSCYEINGMGIERALYQKLATLLGLGFPIPSGIWYKHVVESWAEPFRGWPVGQAPIEQEG